MSQLWHLQQIYTLTALAKLLLQSTVDDPNTKEHQPLEIERIPVLLPSYLPDTLRQHESMAKWCKMEEKFQQAQCSMALDEIWSNLFIKARLHIQQNMHVQNQAASLCSCQVLARNKRKIELSKLQYRAAWHSLEHLVGKECIAFCYLYDIEVCSFKDKDTQPIQSEWKVLKKKNPAPGEGLERGDLTKELSWIWTGSWARKRRWDEELQLYKQEMERTKITLSTTGRQWRTQAGWQEGNKIIAEARRAYALKQVAIQEGLVAKFTLLWLLLDLPLKVNMSVQDVAKEENAELAEESNGGIDYNEDQDEEAGT
ncbi:hypothetical protein AAF712_009432 [Marasmius tenuissimus]|uniref:Uncharacterized protein n=1 Tax=Marasmius tenuissimus TaxID=585030 RepID=A0ABR2ZR35_9AGAR